MFDFITTPCLSVYNPYHRRTNSIPSSYLRRFIFGFRQRNPKMKRRRWQDGRAKVRGWYGGGAMRVLWEGECVKLGIIVESREQFEPLGTVDVIINGIHREGRQRRGTPRRYALRETGG